MQRAEHGEEDYKKRHRAVCVLARSRGERGEMRFLPKCVDTPKKKGYNTGGSLAAHNLLLTLFKPRQRCLELGVPILRARGCRRRRRSRRRRTAAVSTTAPTAAGLVDNRRCRRRRRCALRAPHAGGCCWCGGCGVSDNRNGRRCGPWHFPPNGCLASGVCCCCGGGGGGRRGGGGGGGGGYGTRCCSCGGRRGGGGGGGGGCGGGLRALLGVTPGLSGRFSFLLGRGGSVAARFPGSFARLSRLGLFGSIPHPVSGCFGGGGVGSAGGSVERGVSTWRGDSVGL